MFNVFTQLVHKLKQCTNLILHDENYTFFLGSVLVHKMGEGERGAYSREGAYFKFRRRRGGAYSRGALI